MASNAAAKNIRSPRMRRLASQLASIKISLDPPSPPYARSPTDASISTIKENLGSDMMYLQVPSESDTLRPAFDPLRPSSPPPDRRSSFASTLSDASSVTIPMSTSYQSLLSPMWTSTKHSIDEGELLPEQIQRPRSAQSNPPGDGICVPPVLLSPVLSRPVRSAQSATTSPLPVHNSPIAFHGSDSENSDGAPWRGSGGSVNLARRSLASGSRPTTPIMSPILNRSSSGSRIGALHLTSRSGSGSGLVAGRSLVRRTDSASEADRRRKRLRRRTMIHGALFVWL
ncbi:hypothetical protein Y032_0075g911 [Ancylostoma ceylanicum]|nr:hypothetical protein Y032_0075g911 [Ancylostoma ceylanicum]